MTEHVKFCSVSVWITVLRRMGGTMELMSYLSIYPDGEPFRPSNLSCSAARICGFCII